MDSEFIVEIQNVGMTFLNFVKVKGYDGQVAVLLFVPSIKYYVV